MKYNTDQTGQSPQDPTPGTLGTFGGVFTPSEGDNVDDLLTYLHEWGHLDP
jgi:hypothetical protein